MKAMRLFTNAFDYQMLAEELTTIPAYKIHAQGGCPFKRIKIFALTSSGGMTVKPFISSFRW